MAAAIGSEVMATTAARRPGGAYACRLRIDNRDMERQFSVTPGQVTITTTNF